MKITALAIPSHEEVVRVEDPQSGLLGFIAVHSTVRGPAAGGLRMRPYKDQAAALDDVLALSRGMSFKNAAADLPLGGGKAVIIGDVASKSDAQLRAFGQAINTLAGRYWTAEDMGMTPADMAVIAETTRYVAGRDAGAFASGDPSPITARGIFQSIRTTARHRFGVANLEGRVVAIQGLGHVGWHLGVLLRAAGASLIAADTDAARVEQAARCLGADVVGPEDILTVPADILAPCAIGGVLNARTVPNLNVAAICGGANTQLATPEDGARLAARGILYAPDYIVNAGGIINVATEILRLRDADGFVEAKLAALDATLDQIFGEAKRLGKTPDAVADAIVASRFVPPLQAA
ncbi:MAG: Glu/Leu/Phe/Val dehydrogenase dimerization domain-containing protein [Pseudomonadota bacterium]